MFSAVLDAHDEEIARLTKELDIANRKIARLMELCEMLSGWSIDEKGLEKELEDIK